MKSKTNENLVKKAIAGNNEATLELVQAIANDVLFRAGCLLRNNMDAEDVSQEVLVRVYVGIRELKSPKAFYSWLYKIIINEARRHMTKNYGQESDADISDLIDSLEEVKGDNIPHFFVERDERDKTIVQIINNLPARQREAILLHYYDGLSVNETSKVMDIDHSSVSHYLKIAREKIKSEMKEESEGNAIFAHSTMALPFGVGLARALRGEAARGFPDDATWLRQALERCAQHSGELEAKTGAASVSKAISSSGLVSQALPIVLSAAVAAVSIISTVYVYTNYNVSQMEPPVIKQAATLEAEGDIDFFGDSNVDYLNPLHASAWGSNELGELDVSGWWITPPESPDVLYKGEGCEVNVVFDQIRSDDGAGEYILYFSMADSLGNEYLISRSFVIQ